MRDKPKSKKKVEVYYLSEERWHSEPYGFGNIECVKKSDFDSLKLRNEELEKALAGIEISPDPNGGMQLCVSADGGMYRLRLGEIGLRHTLDKWIAARSAALMKGQK